MNRSQAVSAGVWYNPTPEQRRELKLRAEAFRSSQRRKVQVQLRLVSTRGFALSDIARAFGIPRHLLQPRPAAAAREVQSELRAIRNMLDEVAQ